MRFSCGLLVLLTISLGVFTGCVSDRKLAQGMGQLITPFYEIPMLSTHGYDILYCSAAFRRKNARWPRDYPELSEFVNRSDGYLTLGTYERVDLAQLPDDVFQIAYVPQGFTNEFKIRLSANGSRL